MPLRPLARARQTVRIGVLLLASPLVYRIGLMMGLATMALGFYTIDAAESQMLSGSVQSLAGQVFTGMALVVGGGLFEIVLLVLRNTTARPEVPDATLPGGP